MTSHKTFTRRGVLVVALMLAAAAAHAQDPVPSSVVTPHGTFQAHVGPAPAVKPADKPKVGWAEELGKPGGRERAIKQYKAMTDRNRAANIERMRAAGQIAPIVKGPATMPAIDPETGAPVQPPQKNNTSQGQIQRLFPGALPAVPIRN